MFRAGIESVHPSQRAAARSLGLSNRQALRYVVLPQAVRRQVPPLLNDLVSLQKDTGLVSIGGAVDAVRAAGVHRGPQPQLHAVHRRGSGLRRADHSHDPLHGLGDGTDGPTSGPREESHEPTRPCCAWSPSARPSAVRWCCGTSTWRSPAHTVTALIGASGSGKSTLLRCANLLEEIDDGAIWLDDEEITDPRVDQDAVRRRIGVVFQAYNLFPHLTVLENITLAPRRVHGVPRAEAEARARELLERLGLGGKAGEYPDRLSGGQQQRAAIVRALAVRPRLLLLDEITAALDPELVGEVLTVVRDLKDEGMTMVLATHEMAFAREVADQVCFLEGGVVLERGTAEQVFGEPRQERTRRFLRRIMEAGRL
ncbi:Vitamin B12 import ATP-binding protein BtuD [Streptomyces violarus]